MDKTQHNVSKLHVKLSKVDFESDLGFALYQALGNLTMTVLLLNVLQYNCQ
jgi:hypothetical protein